MVKCYKKHLVYNTSNWRQNKLYTVHRCRTLWCRRHCIPYYSNRAVMLFECRKEMVFHQLRYTLDLKLKRAPLFHPIRKLKLTNVFPRCASGTRVNIKFSLVPCVHCAICDWLEWELLFWFHDTQLKTALCYKDYFERGLHKQSWKLIDFQC